MLGEEGFLCEVSQCGVFVVPAQAGRANDSKATTAPPNPPPKPPHHHHPRAPRAPARDDVAAAEERRDRVGVHPYPRGLVDAREQRVRAHVAAADRLVPLGPAVLVWLFMMVV